MAIQVDEPYSARVRCESAPAWLAAFDIASEAGVNLTLEDIGRLAGVSRSTVSRVINGSNSVSVDVRARVQDVIRRTGYTPNAAARSLVSGRSGVIGLLIPSRVHSIFEDPYFPRLIQGISAASNQSGTTVSLFLSQDEVEEAERYMRVISSGFVDGLIITATRMADPLMVRMAVADVPVVMIGRSEIGGISYVDVDNRGGARQAAMHLCGLGRRRIALVAAPVNTIAGLDRLNGFVDGLASCGLALDPQLRADGDFTEVSGYRAMRQLLPMRPDAVFAGSDTMAMGVLRALREEGVRVPQDVAVVGFAGLAASAQSLAHTGARAVYILNDLMSGAANPPVSEIVPVELVIRESCGARLAGAEGAAGRRVDKTD
jgi:LacI family transcriptional regulator